MSSGFAWMTYITEPTIGVILFNSGFKSDPIKLFPSIVTGHNKSTMALLVISKFLLCTIPGNYYTDNFV